MICLTWLSKYYNYFTNPELGLTIGLYSLTNYKASENYIYYFEIKYAIIIEDDLETPAFQWTNTLFLPFNIFSK